MSTVSLSPTALFKRAPEDFVVDEVDAYPASGDGTHVFARIRKRGLTTDAAISRLALAVGVSPRACGAAGMKDRDAVTTQRVSIEGTTPEAVLALAGRWDDLEILEATRHGNKLKPGHLRANRFRIVLRCIAADALPGVVSRLEKLGVEGFPNAFGPQRFGRDGDNAERALAFVRGTTPPPRDPRQRRFLFSALQSRWFNRVLERRVADGSFRVPMVGDVLKKHASGGLFLCEDVGVDRARALALEVSPTGPIFGAKMTKPGGDVWPLELAVLADDGVDFESLAAHRTLGEGSRRPLRLPLEGLRLEPLEGSGSPGVPGAALVVELTLPKGAYATTVLAEAVELRRPTRPDVSGPEPTAEADDPT